MEKKYILNGPFTIGNCFGYCGTAVPAGKFVIVEDGEYSNGGYGPSTVDGKVYNSYEHALNSLCRTSLESESNYDGGFIIIKTKE